jgi:sodium-dependent phosphate cotransporter
MSDETPVKNQKTTTIYIFLRVLGALFFLYVFLLSIKMMGASFKLFGQGFAETLIENCSNPVVGLFIGILATSLIQSSSTTTSLTVGFVGGGVLPLDFAIPMIMGANMGTSITNTLVSMGFVTRKEDFRRAFAGATVHDFFNLCAVLLLFPLELKFHMIQRLAEMLTRTFSSAGGVTFTNPVKVIIKPVVSLLKHSLIDGAGLAEVAAGCVMLGIAIAALVGSLVFLVKSLRAVLFDKAENAVNKYLFRNDAVALLLGLLLTIMVQSSSVTTSLIVPLVGAGVISIYRCYPYTLGSNIGTTFTALLAALATVKAGEGGCVGVTTAFAHLIFNLMGIAIFYPLRGIPIFLARRLADIAVESKKFAVLFIICLFYGIPLLMIFLTR